MESKRLAFFVCFFHKFAAKRGALSEAVGRVMQGTFANQRFVKKAHDKMRVLIPSFYYFNLYTYQQTINLADVFLDFHGFQYSLL